LNGQEAYSFSGIAIFDSTIPVSALAAFTMPSLPALKSISPSVLYARVLQLPLCRFVIHEVSIVEHPPEVCLSTELFADFIDELELCEDFGELEEEELVEELEEPDASSIGGRV
jgi:hypothetical protein